MIHIFVYNLLEVVFYFLFYFNFPSCDCSIHYKGDVYLFILGGLGGGGGNLQLQSPEGSPSMKIAALRTLSYTLKTLGEVHCYNFSSFF